MKENAEDFFDLVFEKMEDSDSFDMQDSELDKYRKENSDVSDKLYKFINKNIHPKYRQKLLKLIEDRNSTTSNYYFRENQLYYKNGFLQGIYVITSMFYYRKNQSKKD